MYGLIKINGLDYFRIKSEDILNINYLSNATANNKPNKITQHWTAGRYEQAFSDYQILIASDYILVSVKPLEYRKHQHTWKMNTGNIGISYMAMLNRNTCPVTDAMIENMSKVVAVLVKVYNIDWKQVRDHKYYSDNSIPDNYGSEKRIDVSAERRIIDATTKETDDILNISIRKAKWYYDKYLK